MQKYFENQNNASKNTDLMLQTQTFWTTYITVLYCSAIVDTDFVSIHTKSNSIFNFNGKSSIVFMHFCFGPSDECQE